MSLRVALLLLLLGNLAFFAWANFIDVPPPPPPNDSIARLPQLELASEARGKAPRQAAAPVAPLARSEPGAATATSSGASATSTSKNPTRASAVNAASSGPSAPRSGAQPAGNSSVSALASAQGVGAATAAAEAAGPGAHVAPLAATQNRCITIGPFSAQDQTAQAMELLEDRGFVPRERAGQSTQTVYWVFIAALKTQAQEDTIVRRLQRAGIADASAVTNAQHERRISVGLFNGEDGAEQRAQAVRALGLDAKIEGRPRTGHVQWLDVNLGASNQSLPTEGLLSLEGSERLEIRPCPSAAGAQASTSAGSSDSKPLAAVGTANSQ